MQGQEESRGAITARPFEWGGPRPRSIAISLLLHSAAAFALLWFSGGNASQEPTLRDQMIEQPHEHIVWYHLKEIPKISPETSSATAPIRAERLAPEVIIHQAPDAARDDRLVFRAPERKVLPQKTPAPDMIAVARGADATQRPENPVEATPAPNPAKPAPKSFVAPAAPPPAATARIRVEEPPPSPEPPKLVIPDAGLSALTAEAKVRFSRRFVPPPPTKQAAPAEEGGGNVLPDAPALPGSGGASDINVLIVNTVHNGLIDAAPPRRSAVSVGPVTGAASDGGGRSGIQIPGVTVIPRAGTPDPTEASLKSPKDPFKGPIERAGTPQPYVTTRIAPLEHTLSAPLPPSSRNIPKLIEARFRGRIVYTILLPMKGLPGYSGDWTIWFAERETVDGGGSGAPMRAPLPIRKPIRADAAVRDVSPGVVQLSATMNKTGKMDSVAVIGSSGTAPDSAIEDFETWEFLPALRNREAVDIDLIVEIPFGINQKAIPPAGVPVLSGVDRSPRTPHN
jgi:hypothetical protein